MNQKKTFTILTIGGERMLSNKIYCEELSFHLKSTNDCLKFQVATFIHQDRKGLTANFVAQEILDDSEKIHLAAMGNNFKNAQGQAVDKITVANELLKTVVVLHKLIEYISNDQTNDEWVNMSKKAQLHVDTMLGCFQKEILLLSFLNHNASQSDNC